METVRNGISFGGLEEGVCGEFGVLDKVWTRFGFNLG